MIFWSLPFVSPEGKEKYKFAENIARANRDKYFIIHNYLKIKALNTIIN